MRRGSQAFFRVQGTNKTLKRMVVLEATLDNSPVAFTAAKSAGHPAPVAPRQPGGTVLPKKDERAESLNHKQHKCQIHLIQYAGVQGLGAGYSLSLYS